MNTRLALAVMIAFFALSGARAESFKSWSAGGAREQHETDPQSALSSYCSALTMWEEDAGAAAKAKGRCARANLREKDGDEAGAIEDFTGCVAIDKKNAKSFHRRG